MIYPTRAAVIAVAAGIPVAIAVAAVDPGQWFLALAWPLAVVLLCLADAAQAAPAARVEFECPAFAYVGETRDSSISIQLRVNNPLLLWIDLRPIVCAPGPPGTNFDTFTALSGNLSKGGRR